jgi:hypothetical protein
MNDTGFHDCDSLTVLGMKITNDQNMTVATNFKNIKQKIENQINFWKRFNLSLPGRIDIAKTMLYSQINYLGCFFNFSPLQLSAWSDQIFSYVKGNLNISKKKAFSNIKLGGAWSFRCYKFFGCPKMLLGNAFQDSAA